MRILQDFNDKMYPEQEVNNIIKKYFEDYTLIRRELVNFGYMQRNSSTGEYWVVKIILTKEDISKNTLLKKHAESYHLN